MKTLKEQGVCGPDCPLKFTTQCLARCDMTEEEQLDMWRARPDKPTESTIVFSTGAASTKSTRRPTPISEVLK